MAERAKFKYSIQEGLLELEGTEDFVSKHFSYLTEMVNSISQRGNRKEATKEESPQGTLTSGTKEIGPISGANNSPPSDAESIHSYPTAYAESNGKLKLVTDIPGVNTREKMTNIALLYCYGAHLMGNDEVVSKDIRETCETHGCLDPTNFSRAYGDKTLFLTEGVKGGTKHLKLTFQGKKRAKELLEHV